MSDLILKNLSFATQQIKERLGIYKSRRAFFLFILVATIVLYFLSKWTPRRSNYKTVLYDACIQERLDAFAGDAADKNAIFNHEPIHYEERASLPFTGNGYVGISHSGQSHLQLISDTNAPFISTGYSPIVQIHSATWEVSSATVLHMNHGLVRRLQCFKTSTTRSAYVTHLLYAHRHRPSLIVQEIDIVNPSEQTLDLSFALPKSVLSSNLEQLEQSESSDSKSFITTYKITLRDHTSILFVSITSKTPSKIHVKPNSQDKYVILTVVKFSPILNNDKLHNTTFLNRWKTTLQKQAAEELGEVLEIKPKSLLRDHIQTWTSIWQSGFSISHSLAPSVMNGDVINRTIYYVLCSTPSPLYDSKLDDTTRIEYNQSLFQIDRCYEGHSTLVGDKLWRAPGDDLAVSQLSLLWRSTLSKKGCSTLMKSGVNGMLQSMLISIGGIRFRNHHLELNLDPKELHRDMFFRAIHFGKQYCINITITVGQDNRAVIDVSIDNDNTQTYACDAGCLDSYTKLSTTPVRFPVKMTNPATAILYITEDLEYMTQLKDTLHVKEVEIAPPHAHDILALHRHGHKLGGLPVIFWIALAFLIVIFHLFLLKIVLNEMGFFKHTSITHPRPRTL
ncbi:unnamed protein product [Adineta ricciae]|uniref:Uncharacterized protein n=1 Tax=Adineta ricciae TaxID=249248 RepID=A0A813XH16_ADIRI|nr:unnamed protein product [Adineta ricciae]